MMPADEHQKWPSPHGHAISSDVTDKMPRVEPQPDLLAEAVKVIEFYALRDNHTVRNGGEQFTPMKKDLGQRARDFLAKIGEQNDH
jgi:hypothetical protein